MQSQQPCKVRKLGFVGSVDPTIWLEDNNGEQNPCILPVWPGDYPEHLPVWLDESGEVGVALSREAMLAACRPSTLTERRQWFCNIPLRQLLDATDADPATFERTP
jgi:hypothetical protein